MFSNPFNTKTDPLLGVVTEAMKDGETRRQAEAIVNEAFGVYSRKAVVNEEIAEYDASVEEVYTALKEGVQIDEIKVSTAWSYSGKKMEKERKGLLPGDLNPSSKTDLKNMTNAANRTDKDYYKKRGFKKVDEGMNDLARQALQGMADKAGTGAFFQGGRPKSMLTTNELAKSALKDMAAKASESPYKKKKKIKEDEDYQIDEMDSEGIIKRYHKKAVERLHTGEETPERRQKGRQMATRKRHGGIMDIPRARVMATNKERLDEVGNTDRGRAALNKVKNRAFNRAAAEIHGDHGGRPNEKTVRKNLDIEDQAKKRLREGMINEVGDTEKGRQRLGRYIKNASHDVAARSAMTRGYAMKSDADRKEGKYMDAKRNDERSNKMFNKSWKRREGIAKAVDRLMKENQLDEIVVQKSQMRPGETLGMAMNRLTGKTAIKGGDNDVNKVGSSAYKASQAAGSSTTSSAPLPPKRPASTMDSSSVAQRTTTAQSQGAASSVASSAKNFPDADNIATGKSFKAIDKKAPEGPSAPGETGVKSAGPMGTSVTSLDRPATSGSSSSTAVGSSTGGAGSLASYEKKHNLAESVQVGANKYRIV